MCGSGRHPNLHTGTGNVCGGHTKKFLDSHTYNRLCRKCSVTQKGKKPKQHDCIKNWEHGVSSKSMEPVAILHITKNAPSKGYCIGTLVSDDDSTMYANLSHYSNERGSKEKLPKHILEPYFLADLMHRNKAVSSHFSTWPMHLVSIHG